MRNSGEKRLQKTVSVICTLFFALFAFTFVAVYKSPLLEMVYDCVATGKLRYNGYVVSALFTLALVCFAWWLNSFAKFHREWTAVAFLPSALVLAFATDVKRSFFTGCADYSLWICAFAVGFTVYAFLSFVLRRMLFVKIKNISMAAGLTVWRNMILLTLLFLMVGLLSGGDKSFRSEARQYVFYKRGDVSAALSVDANSVYASHALTAQRAFLLSLTEGEMGERLFCFPQYYGSEGLLPNLHRDEPITPDSIYSRIGVERLDDETVCDYLVRSVSGNSKSIVVRDYYLASLLLDRRLVDFATRLFEFYRLDDAARLPRHCKEALVLYAHIVPDFALPLDADDNVCVRFACFLQKTADDAVSNTCLYKEFGNTYWWYFLYGC